MGIITLTILPFLTVIHSELFVPLSKNSDFLINQTPPAFSEAAKHKGKKHKKKKKKKKKNKKNPPPSDGSKADLGIGAAVYERPFPADNWWNKDISAEPVDPSSTTIINTIGANDNLHPDFGTFWEGSPIGIPYVVVSGSEPGDSVTFDYDDESDHVPYPIPNNAPIEGGEDSDGDRHILVVDRDNWILYELFYAFKAGSNSWTAGSGAVFDLSKNDLRPAGWTSADAAGLPIFPGLVRYDEVLRGEINHAIRFTVQHTRRAYITPARHYASSLTGSQYPPMGMRVRLKADFDISGFSTNNQVILRALKKYGMILADNGSDWFMSGAHDERWSDDELSELKDLKGSNFEVVLMENIVTD